MTVGIDEGAVIEYIVTTFPDLQCEVVQGNWFFFRGADRKVPAITLMSNDAFDTYSDLGRPSVYRLNIGVSSDTFDRLVSGRPARAPSTTPSPTGPWRIPNTAAPNGCAWSTRARTPSPRRYDRCSQRPIPAANRR
ncbi:Uncharacterised protein [Mycobacteroides abscessus]|nr:Uncharacterised protein [Mycobacteroides abscessus]